MGRFSIFIVDDNSLYTYFLNESLQEYGNFNVTTFDSAEKCLLSLGEHPNLIILDYFLEKGMNGLDAFTAIKQKHPEVPVVVLSAQSDVQIAADLVQAGVYEYLEKRDDQLLYKLQNTILSLKHK